MYFSHPPHNVLQTSHKTLHLLYLSNVPGGAGRGYNSGNAISSCPQESTCVARRFSNVAWRREQKVLTKTERMHAVEKDGEPEGTFRRRWEPLVENSQRTLLPSPAERRSPSFSLCGPELRVIPKQSTLIQGARGPGAQHCQSTLGPGPTLTHATQHPLNTQRHAPMDSYFDPARQRRVLHNPEQQLLSYNNTLPQS